MYVCVYFLNSEEQKKYLTNVTNRVGTSLLVLATLKFYFKVKLLVKFWLGFGKVFQLGIT